MEGKVFEVKLVRSPIGTRRTHREVLKGMGLRRIGAIRVMSDTHQNRGMIFKMSHMVSVKSFKSMVEYEKFVKTMDRDVELPVVIESIPDKVIEGIPREKKSSKEGALKETREEQHKEPKDKEPSAAKKGKPRLKTVKEASAKETKNESKKKTLPKKPPSKSEKGKSKE